jgi:hypothetical protein
VKTTDTNILKVIVIKLQKRVEEKESTLLIKVTTHHGCPLNEEVDIRTEMGRIPLGKRNKKRPGVSQPTEPSTSDPRPLRLRTGHSPPNNQCGLKQSATGFDRKQVKSKSIDHTKMERKNGSGI